MNLFSFSQSQQRGFTLVEVMVSLTVLSLVMLATVSAMRTFANTQATIERKIYRVDEIRSVSSFLRDALQSNVIDVGGGGLSLGGSIAQKAYFRGDSGGMAWKAPMSFGEGYGGTFLIRLAPESGQLVLRWLLADDDIEDEEIDWAGAEHRPVIDNLEGFDLAYKLNPEEGWQEGIVVDTPPLAVRMSIKSSGRFWPELIAEVQR